MTDNEKNQVEEITKALKSYAYDLKLCDSEDCRRLAEFIVLSLGYRKADNNENEIIRLQEACGSAVRDFTRMETLYKIKCNELEYSVKKTKADTAKEILQYLYERIGNTALSDNELVKNLALQYGVIIDE